MSSQTTIIPPAREGKELKKHEKQNKNSNLIGNCSDTKETRNKWIDTVEKMLDFQAFGKGEISSRKKYDEVMVDGDYGLKEPERWMLAPGLN